MGLLDPDVMACDRLQCPRDIDHPGGFVGAFSQEEGQSFCECLNRGQVRETGDRLDIAARQDDCGRKSADLSGMRLASDRSDWAQRAIRHEVVTREPIEPGVKIAPKTFREILQRQGPEIMTIWSGDLYIRPADDPRACGSPTIDGRAVGPVRIFQ